MNTVGIFIAWLCGVIISIAAPIFFVKFLFDIFMNDLPFWYSVFTNVLQCIGVEIIAWIILWIAACFIKE